MRYLALMYVLFSALQAEQLPIRVYTTADGLPHNWITCIRRDPRGYLWFGTREGVARFDGYTFVSYAKPEGLTNGNVTDLLVTREGDIWASTSEGLFRFRPRGLPPFLAYRSSSDLNASSIYSLAQDNSGMIWIATAGGLYRLDPRSDSSHPPARVDVGDQQLWRNPVALIADRAGTLWIGAERLYRRWPDGRIERLDNPASFPSWNGTLLEASDGKVWIGGDSLSRVAPGSAPGQLRVEHRYSASDGLRRAAEVLFQSSDRQIWIASLAGLSQVQSETGPVQPPIRPYGPADRLAIDSVQSLGEDREGNLWLGCTFGAMKIARNALISYDRTDGLGDTRVASIFENHTGEMFVITTGAAALGGTPFLNRWDGRRFVRAPIQLPKPLAFTDGWNQIAIFDQTGAWWTGTSNGGVCRYPQTAGIPAAAFRRPAACYTTQAGSAEKVSRIFEDSRGDIWVSADGTDTGLARFDRATGSLRKYSAADGVPARRPETGYRTPIAFREDRAGAVWIGSSQWLARYREGRFTVFGESDGLRDLVVADMHVDHAGRLWIAGGLGGLYRVDHPDAERPRFQVYTQAQGLSGDRILCVTEDHSGRIYACTGRGIDRFDPDSPVDPVRVRHYTSADGLALGTPQEAFCDRNGTLWFGTLQGLSSLVPEPDVQRLPPPVLVSGIKIQGVHQRLSELGETEVSGLTLAPGRNQVQIEFVGLGFASGEMLRYQSKLERSDADWSPPTVQRSINYASLAPGQYRFLVRALNSSGQSSSPPASVEFTVLAPVWRRWWFLSLCGVVVAAAIYTLYRYRLAHMLALERVRTRIATDLHDDVGASLSQIAILSEVLRDRIASEDPRQADPIARIAGISRELIDSMSDIVWAISPRYDRLLDLTRRMREFAEQMLVPRDIELDFHASVPEDLRAGAEVRRQVYLIFKECIHNIVRHAECSLVTVRVSLEEGALISTVTDNGCGFEPRPSEGTGLRSIEVRAASLLGTCTIESRTGGGTSVKLFIPSYSLRLKLSRQRKA